MVNECPVCRHAVNVFRTMLRRSAWTCATCGSLIVMDKGRRYLALMPCTAITLLGAIYLTRSGWAGDWVAAPLSVAAWFSFMLLLDRANVLERRGFRCRKCGYDLRGQIDPLCPECGRQFDSSETVQMELPDPTQLVQGQERRRGYLGLVFGAVVLLALLVLMIKSITAYGNVAPRGPTTPPATSSSAEGSQP